MLSQSVSARHYTTASCVGARHYAAALVRDTMPPRVLLVRGTMLSRVIECWNRTWELSSPIYGRPASYQLDVPTGNFPLPSMEGQRSTNWMSIIFVCLGIMFYNSNVCTTAITSVSASHASHASQTWRGFTIVNTKWLVLILTLSLWLTTKWWCLSVSLTTGRWWKTWSETSWIWGPDLMVSRNIL